VCQPVRSLEVRWIFPGRLTTAVARWFARFPARTQSRQDTYLLEPPLPGVSVKVRGGGPVEMKVYRGSPGILEVAGRARGRLEIWQKWPLALHPLRPGSGEGPAGDRYASGGGSAGSHSPAGRSWRMPSSGAASRGAGWNSPRSAPAVDRARAQITRSTHYVKGRPGPPPAPQAILRDDRQRVGMSVRCRPFRQIIFASRRQ
jgi:hypothetical protein